MALGQLLAVGRIEIPLAACGLFTPRAGFHQHPVGLAHPAIEGLHQIRLLAFELLGQIAPRR